MCSNSHISALDVLISKDFSGNGTQKEGELSGQVDKEEGSEPQLFPPPRFYNFTFHMTLHFF